MEQLGYTSGPAKHTTNHDVMDIAPEHESAGNAFTCLDMIF